MQTEIAKNIFVTGGNSGIGLALCQQLAAHDDCYVFMGSRSAERGHEALCTCPQEIRGQIEVVQCDIANPASVLAAAEHVRGKVKYLYALVNNAGAGLSHNVSADNIHDVNLFGTKTMVDNFVPLLHPQGRIVNVGSGAGPMWLEQQSAEIQALLTSGTLDWAGIHQFLQEHRNDDARHAYGLSKCLLNVYSEAIAREHPGITTSCISPGFIETNISRGMGASKTPEEGTISIRHCLFQKLNGNGWFYGSDAVRSPFYPCRSPGDAPFIGTYPWNRSSI